MSGISRRGGMIPVVLTSNDPITMVPNHRYILFNSGGINLTLPALAPAGSEIEIVGHGGSGFNILQNASQFIRYGLTSVTTTGVGSGYQTSDAFATIRIITASSNAEFQVTNSQGTFTPFEAPPVVGPFFKANQFNSTLPAVRFTGSEGLANMTDALTALYGVNVSIFAYLRFNTTHGTTWSIQYMPSSSGPYGWLLGPGGGELDSNMNFFLGTSDPSSVAGSYNVVNNTPFLQSIIYDGTTLQFRHNGISDGSGTPNYGTPTGDLQDNSSGLVIGKVTDFGGDAAAYFDLAELIIYNEAVSNGDRDAIETYFSDKYTGSGSVFNPFSVSGCAALYRADLLGLTDGDPVTFWEDLINGINLTPV
jgi:hypothetical protein